MATNHTFARQVRLRRLFHRASDRIFIVPLDHSVTEGPITGGQRLDQLVAQLSGNGVDALVLHKGSARHIDPKWFLDTSFILHLSASTVHAPDPDAKYLVTGVEEALRIGADAVSVHVNLGSREERHQLADLAAVAEACDRWSVPLLAMVYPRGPAIDNPFDPGLIAHAITLATDLGADIVKTVHPGSTEALHDIVSWAHIPVVIAGGPHRDDPDEVVAHVESVLDGGAIGVAMGRNIFQATTPGSMARRVAALVHRAAAPMTAPDLEMTAG